MLRGEVSPTSSRGFSESTSSSPSLRDSPEDTSTGFYAVGAPGSAGGTSPRTSKVGLEATNSSRSLHWNRGMKALGGYSWLSPNEAQDGVQFIARQVPWPQAGLVLLFFKLLEGARVLGVGQPAASRTPSGASPPLPWPPSRCPASGRSSSAPTPTMPARRQAPPWATPRWKGRCCWQR